MKSFSRVTPLLFLVLVICGCGATLQKSLRLDHGITIDGKLSDWPDITAKDADQKILVRTFDDEKSIYVSILVKDPAYARTILAGGLKTWFDPEGGKDKAFAVVFPVGMGDLDYQAKDVDRKLRDPEALDDLVKVMTESAQTVDAKGTTKRWTLEELQADGFEAQTTFSNGGFVCEMKLPLETARTKTCSLVLGKDRVIGLGLEAKGLAETPPAETDVKTRSTDGSPEAGITAGGGMHPHSGMGHREKGSRSGGYDHGGAKSVKGFKHLKTWLKIVLSPEH